MFKIIASHIQLGEILQGISATQQRLEKYSINPNTNKYKRLSERLHDLNHIFKFFEENKGCTFIGFEGRGQKNHGIGFEVKTKHGYSQIHSLHWQDSKGKYHHTQLGSNITLFDNQIDKPRRTTLSESPTDVERILTPRSVDYTGNTYNFASLKRTLTFSQTSNSWEVRTESISDTYVQKTPSQHIPMVTPSKLLDHCKDLHSEYQRTSSQNYKAQKIKIQLNKEKQGFLLTGLSKNQAKELHVILEGLQQRNPSILFAMKTHMFKSHHIKLNMTAVHALRESYELTQACTHDSHPLYSVKHILNQINTTTSILEAEHKVQSVISHSCKLKSIISTLKYDGKTGNYRYNNSDRTNHYTISGTEFKRLFSNQTELHPTIKGKASLGSNLLRKYGLGIPQAIYGFTWEGAHKMTSHGDSADFPSLFIDGADDTDMVGATQRSSVSLIKGLSTFLLLPMANTLLDDAVSGKWGDIEDSRQAQRQLEIFKRFMQRQSTDLGKKDDYITLRNELKEFLETLDDNDTLKEFYFNYGVESITNTKDLATFFTAFIEKLEETIDDTQESRYYDRWLYRAIWCMATGLKLHFIAGGITAAGSLSGLMPTPVEHQGGIRDFNSMNPSSQIQAIGDLVANPIAFLGQSITSILSFKEAWEEKVTIQDLRKSLSNLEKVPTTDSDEFNQYIRDCMEQIKKEGRSIWKKRGLLVALGLGQGLMAIGTTLSTAFTAGLTGPAATIQMINTLQLYCSVIGLGGTIIGAGGSGINDFIHDKKFKGSYEVDEMRQIYQKYYQKLFSKDRTRIGDASEQMTLFMESVDEFMKENQDEMIKPYLHFKTAECVLSDQTRCHYPTEKYYKPVHQWRTPRQWINGTTPDPIQRYPHIKSFLSDHEDVDMPKVDNSWHQWFKNIHRVFWTKRMEENDWSYIYDQFFPQSSHHIPDSVSVNSDSSSAYGDHTESEQDLLENVSENQPLLDEHDHNKLTTIVAHLLHDPEYRQSFHELLTQRIYYSHTKDKNTLFNEFQVSKKRQGLTHVMNHIRGPKIKHLRIISENELLKQIKENRNQQLVIQVTNAIVDLISLKKMEGKEHIRGVAYTIPKLFAHSLTEDTRRLELSVRNPMNLS